VILAAQVMKYLFPRQCLPFGIYYRKHIRSDSLDTLAKGISFEGLRNASRKNSSLFYSFLQLHANNTNLPLCLRINDAQHRVCASLMLLSLCEKFMLLISNFHPVWVLCSLFWVIPRRLDFMCQRYGKLSVPSSRRLNFIWRRFGKLCSIFQASDFIWRRLGKLCSIFQASELYMTTFRETMSVTSSRLLNFVCRRFETLPVPSSQLYHLWRWNRRCSETLTHKIQNTRGITRKNKNLSLFNWFRISPSPAFYVFMLPKVLLHS